MNSTEEENLDNYFNESVIQCGQCITKKDHVAVSVSVNALNVSNNSREEHTKCINNESPNEDITIDFRIMPTEPTFTQALPILTPISVPIPNPLLASTPASVPIPKPLFVSTL